MADRYPSIYQRARKDACLTQEQAAELLSVSVETVKAWEQGGGDLSVITWGFVLIGICTLTSGLFRLVDRIEGRR